MAIQTSSLQRDAPAFHRVPHRYSNSLRPHDRRIKARYVPLSVPLPATTGDPTRILIVDDILTTRPLEHQLHSLGYWTTRVALSGEMALKVAQDFAPSVVLLAIELADMSSYRLATQLRNRAGARELRLIALTGDCAYPGRDLARQAGFERYLAKPVNIGTLNQLLRLPGGATRSN
ncbi:MAG: response regulator [Steroidobacteraceae bacterium]